MEQPAITPAGRQRRVFMGIRVDQDVADGLAAIARRDRIPASTLARSYLTRQLTDELARQGHSADEHLDVTN